LDVTLRFPQPGDLGWVIARHGSIYATEYGLDSGFEIAVAGIVFEVMSKFDPARDGAWIAVLDGRPVGSIFVVGVEDNTCKLRMLILDAEARGRGVGSLLVRTAIQFARERGYETMTLWTMSMLTAARAIYAREGFELVASVPGVSFGREIVDETWKLKLGLLGA
jgi:GNAT superfamily N-acetyltransferase